MLDGYPTIELIDVVYNRIIENDTELTHLRAENARLTAEVEAAAELITATENSVDDYGHTPFHYLGGQLIAYQQARAARVQAALKDNI